MTSRRFLIQDIGINDEATHVVGVLHVHKTDTDGVLKSQGTCVVKCALTAGNSVSASCFLGEDTLPELTDEEWEMVHTIIRVYTSAVLHKTMFVAWGPYSKKSEENNPKPNKFQSHYDWLEEHLPEIFRKAGIEWIPNVGIIVAHGDKAYGYQDRWEKAGIHFYHGVALYLLTYCKPYSSQCRVMANCGWYAPDQWVIDKYDAFKPILPPVD